MKPAESPASTDGRVAINRLVRNVAVAVTLGVAAIAAWAVGTDRASYVVTYGVSMHPVYHQDDLVFVIKDDTYGIGDIAAYYGTTNGLRVLHRIIGGDATTGFVLKGDNNQSTDVVFPTADEMIGKAVLHVPNGGIWLKPLLGPQGLGMIGFLIVGGGATAARTRREIPRGRRKKKVKAMARQDGSLATAAAVIKTVGSLPPRLRIAAAAVAAITGLALALGILGWMKPTVETRRVTSAPAQSIAFSYSAKVPKSPAYDDTTVSAPEPVFRKLTNQVDLRTLYRGPAGTFRLTARLTNGTGWHTTRTLVTDKPFSGTSHDTTVKLNLKELADRADSASRAIGAAANGTVTVDLNARVTANGVPAFDAPLQLRVDPLQMTVATAAALQTDNANAVSQVTLVERQIGISGHSVLTAARARAYAILLLLLAGAGAAAIFLLSRRGRPLITRAEIERRHPQLLVHVEPMASPPGKPVVNVDNFQALVKLAERYGQMVLTWRRPDADDFVVRDEGITYRYRIPLEEPLLQNVEHINRPNSAGTHRRKASSSVS